MKASTVADVMTHLVVTVRPEDPIPRAAQHLLSNRISGAPVVHDGKLVGVVSEADLVRAYARPTPRGFVAPHPLLSLMSDAGPRRDVRAITVGDVMATDVIYVGPDAGICEAASLIDHHGVRRLPVVAGEGYVVGVLTRSDLVRCMARGEAAV
jgi:CBS domain-containing protein